MDDAIWSAVENLVGRETRLALAVTGGGSALLHWLFDHPGASRVLVEAQIPYASAALSAYLQRPGPHRVTRQTARDMSWAAYERARRDGSHSGPHWGIGLTAALATGRERRGEDRVHLALRTAGRCYFHHLILDKGAASRTEQEQVVSRWALSHIAEQLDISYEPLLPSWTERSSECIDLRDPLGLLLSGSLDVVEVTREGICCVDVEPANRLLYPGSFNPLHEGHCQLAEVAGQLSGRSVALEISVRNVDKPTLERAALEERLAELQGRFAVCLTREPTFFGKASHFSAPHFVIGCDTAMRLVDGKYYEGGHDGMVQSLLKMRADGVLFWVAGRSIDGVYRTLSDVEVPAELGKLFCSIPETAFRMDVSSTEIRARQRAQ